MSENGAVKGPPVRVVLAELPSIVTAIVRDAVREESIRIVDEVREPAELLEVVTRRRADVVIVPNETSGVARRHHELLRRRPGLRILTIAAMHDGADLFELRLLGSNVGRLGVVAAIRRVMGDRASSAGESSPT